MVEAFAAAEACGVAVHGADAANDDVALGTDVGQAFEGASLGEREGVACRFTGDSEVCTGDFPFGAVCGDASSTVPILGDEVCEFVKDDACDLFFRDVGLEEFGIEGDEGVFGGGEACGAAESVRPFHGDAFGEGGEAERAGGGAHIVEERLEMGVVGIGCFGNPDGERGCAHCVQWTSRDRIAARAVSVWWM